MRWAMKPVSRPRWFHSAMQLACEATHATFSSRPRSPSFVLECADPACPSVGCGIPCLSRFSTPSQSIRHQQQQPPPSGLKELAWPRKQLFYKKNKNPFHPAISSEEQSRPFRCSRRVTRMALFSNFGRSSVIKPLREIIKLVSYEKNYSWQFGFFKLDRRTERWLNQSARDHMAQNGSSTLPSGAKGRDRHSGGGGSLGKDRSMATRLGRTCSACWPCFGGSGVNGDLGVI